MKDPKTSRGWLASPFIYLLMGAGILLLDIVTGPFLLFPILFVLPVALSAWHYSARWAYALSVVLPLGRLAIAWFIEHPQPPVYMLANALIRMAVLGSLAHFVAKSARQARELRERYEGLVTICAWSRTILHEGEWLSVEQYLQRRFRISTTHGMSPAEVAKMMAEMEATQPPVKP